MIPEYLQCKRELPFDREELISRINSQPYSGQDGIRMMFLPARLTEQNVDEFCYVYRQIADTRYDVVVIVEPDDNDSVRKIPVLPGNAVRTSFGTVPLDERLRDDFCDEEDDFLIRQKGELNHLGFFDHVSMLQLIQNDFKVVGMQLLDESPPIVQELTYVLKEILPFKNALTIFCCELEGRHQPIFETLRQAIHEKNDTRLLNLIYGGESKIRGAGVFLAGVMTARAREREIRFYREDAQNPEQNLLASHAGFPAR